MTPPPPEKAETIEIWRPEPGKPLAYVQFFHREFLDDEEVAAMTLDAQAVFVRLILKQPIAGSLPVDLAALAALVPRLTLEQLRVLWPEMKSKFRRVLVDGVPRLYNTRMELACRAVQKGQTQRSEAGLRSAEARRKKATAKKQRPFNGRSTAVQTAAPQPVSTRAFESVSVSDSESGFSSSGVAPQVQLQTTIDDPDPQLSAPRRIGKLFADLRATVAGMSRVESKAINAYTRLAAKLVKSGHPVANLEVLCWWFASTSDGRKAWQFGMGVLPAPGREHVLDRNIGDYMPRARLAFEANSGLAGAVGAPVIELVSADAGMGREDLDAWLTRARSYLAETNDPETVQRIFAQLAIERAEWFAGDVKVLLTASDENALRHVRGRHENLAYAFERTSDPPARKLHLAIELAATAEKGVSGA